jgi:predicted enzyme related to lactoylglutathione lyase
MTTLNTYGKISFLYFDNLENACQFFEETLNLELSCDQGWSKIYKVCNGAYIGAVDSARGACQATTRDCVLTSFVVKDHEDMVTRLIDAGIKFTKEPKYSEALQIKSLLFEGPEGYMFEVEEFISEKDRKAFYNLEIDEFSRVVGIMGAFAEVVACGAKKMALGAPVSDKDLRDKHYKYAKNIAEQRNIFCRKEDKGFLSDLFPATMNRDKYNILFYKDKQTADDFDKLKLKKETLMKNNEYHGGKRFQIAYDFGVLLSYADQDIKRMINENKDLE